MPDKNDFTNLNWEIADLLRGRCQPLQYERANPGMNASGQRASSFLQTERAQFAAVFVVRKHVGPTFFGDSRTATMKALGR